MSDSSRPTFTLDVVKEALDRLSDQGSGNGSWAHWDGDWGVPARLEQFMALHKSSIPTLRSMTGVSLPTGSLVRYRGMIQDMYDPEYYPDVARIDSSARGVTEYVSGRYRDSLFDELRPVSVDFELSPQTSKIEQRLPMYMVPIPHESLWNQEADKAEWPDATLSGADSGAQSEGLTSGSPSHGNEKKKNKRRMSSEGPDQESNGTSKLDEGADVSTGGHASELSEVSPTKKTKDSSTTSMSTSGPATVGTYAQARELNVINYDGRCPAIVLFYDDAHRHEGEEQARPKINDVVEVLAFLSVNSSRTIFENDPQGAEVDFFDEQVAHSPPSSLVPRLHCVSYRKLGHSNSLVPQAPLLGTSISYTEAEGLALRDAIVEFISSGLGGDTLVAEYLLLSLLSGVNLRRQDVAVGNLPINIIDVGRQGIGRHLLAFLETLLPNAAYMPLSREFLQSRLFSPAKDINKNRLTTGPLQLPPGTGVVVDEAVLTEGSLGPIGTRNILAIKESVASQIVYYDDGCGNGLKFYSNLRYVVVSDGKSLMEVECCIPMLSRQPIATPSVPSLFGAAFLDRARRYLTATPALFERTALESEEVGLCVQNDFAYLRQAGESVSEASLHVWLTMARLRAISLCHSSVTEDDWKWVMELEKRRREALLAYGPRAA